eukprot:gnl/Trimastix_PCT/3095.p1 GENE.gnl/Trimastix_PCT/3095~~gnl/Trimastix_PCT/3095.p1  ORF type:complete len:1087 (+),score=305.46 gnl/Trimastix_PCT/3095:79-3339(+)
MKKIHQKRKASGRRNFSFKSSMPDNQTSSEARKTAGPQQEPNQTPGEGGEVERLHPDDRLAPFVQILAHHLREAEESHAKACESCTDTTAPSAAHSAHLIAILRHVYGHACQLLRGGSSDAMKDAHAAQKASETIQLEQLLEAVRCRRQQHDAEIPSATQDSAFLQEQAQRSQSDVDRIFAALSYRKELEPLEVEEVEDESVAELQKEADGNLRFIELDALREILRTFRDRLAELPPLLKGTTIPVGPFVAELRQRCMMDIQEGTNLRSFVEVDDICRKLEDARKAFEAARQISQNPPPSGKSHDLLWSELEQGFLQYFELRSQIHSKLADMINGKKDTLMEKTAEAQCVMSLAKATIEEDISCIEQTIIELLNLQEQNANDLNARKARYEEDCGDYVQFLGENEREMNLWQEEALKAIAQYERAHQTRVDRREEMCRKKRELQLLEGAAAKTAAETAAHHASLTQTREREMARLNAQDFTMNLTNLVQVSTKHEMDVWTQTNFEKRDVNIQQWRQDTEEFVRSIVDRRIEQRLTSRTNWEDRIEQAEAGLAESNALADDDLRKEAEAQLGKLRAFWKKNAEEIKRLLKSRADLVRRLREAGVSTTLSEDAQEQDFGLIPQVTNTRMLEAAPHDPALISARGYPMRPRACTPDHRGAYAHSVSEAGFASHVGDMNPVVFQPVNGAAPAICSECTTAGAAPGTVDLDNSGSTWVRLQGGKYVGHFPRRSESSPCTWEISHAVQDRDNRGQSRQVVHIRRIRSDASLPLGHLRELLTVLCDNSHPNWHNLVDWFEEDSYIYVVLEPLGRAFTLQDRVEYHSCLREHEPNPAERTVPIPSERTVAHIASQILNGVKWLATLGIAVPGLSLATVYLHEMNVRLLDLHVHAFLDKYHMRCDIPECDQAPEERDPSAAPVDPHKADVYRVGLIVMRFVAPHIARLPVHEQRAVFEEATRELSPELCDFVKCATEADPTRRHTLDQLMGHDFLQEAKFDPQPEPQEMCPITMAPITTPIESHGVCFERAALQLHVRAFHSHPTTRAPMCLEDLSPCTQQSSASAAPAPPLDLTSLPEDTQRQLIEMLQRSLRK